MTFSSKLLQVQVLLLVDFQLIWYKSKLLLVLLLAGFKLCARMILENYNAVDR